MGTTSTRGAANGARRAWGRRGAALAVAMGLVAAGCSDAGSDDAQAPEQTIPSGDQVVAWEGDPQTGGTLLYGLVAESNTYDPGTAQWASSGITVSRAIFDTLTTWDAEGRAVPFLAETVEPTDDSLTTWRITVREGVTFHDGVPLDAAAVAASIEHARTSPTLTAAFATTTGIEAVDERTVEWTFSEPFAALPEALTGQAGVVVAPSMLAAGAEGGRNPVGTGPFVFKEWVPNSHLLVERNEDYWREGLPYLDAIDFRIFTDSTARVNALQAGEIDMIEATEAGPVDRLVGIADEGEIQLLTNTEGEGSKSLVVLNTEQPPFDDVRVRRAIAHGIDREAVSQAASNGRNRPADSVFTEGSPYWVDSGYPDFDPAEASRLVAEYEAEVGPVAFALNSPPDPEISAIAQQIQQQMADVGIDMTINGIDQTTLIANAVTGSYEATLFRLFGSPVPDGQFVFLSSDTIQPTGISLNVARLADPDIDAALDGMLSTLDPTEKAAAYADLQTAMSEALGILFLLRATAAVAADNSVRGFDAWELPDGSPGLAQSESVPMLAQIWLAR